MANLVTNEASANLESIQYHLEEIKPLSRKEGTPVYVARVDVKETYAIADVAQRMVAEGCAVKAATVSLVLSEFAELVGKLMREGRAVNIGGVVRFTPSIRGRFEAPEAEWDTSRHSVVVNALVGSRLRSAASGSAVQRVGAVTLPKLEGVYNMSDGVEGTIASEGILVVKGTRLTWDAEREDEGFFLDLAGARTKCVLQLSRDNDRTVVIRTTQVMSAGDEPELWFYTRLGGNALYQVKFEGELICTE